MKTPTKFTQEMDPLLEAVLNADLDTDYSTDKVREHLAPVEFSPDPISPALRFPYCKAGWLEGLVCAVHRVGEGRLCVTIDPGDYGRFDVVVARERPRFLTRTIKGSTKTTTRRHRKAA